MFNMNGNMTRECVIYALEDKAGNIGYIGSTKVNAKTRWWEHRSRARAGHAAPVYDWIRSIGIDNLQYRVLKSVQEIAEVEKVEASLIKSFIESGHPIQNQMGRDGVPKSHTERTKKIVSEKKKGKPTWIKGKRGEEAGWTEERRARQSQTMKARKNKQCQ